MDNEKSQKSPKKYNCTYCNYLTCNKYDYNKHLQTKKHKNNIMDNQKTLKCECGKTYKYLSGLSKHKKQCTYKKNDTEMINGTKMVQNGTKMVHINKEEIINTKYICNCGKKYKYHTGYYRHRKKCPFLKNEDNKEQIIKYQQSEISELKELFIKMIEKNDETTDKLIELAKEPKTTINNNNTQFNVMNYLNTECKDAMNFSDFINDFVFSLDDLNLLHEKGYQEAMEQTFIKQLQDMDKTKRPIHCSDKKRKSFYIKDKDIWIKDENNIKILDGVKEITHKQFGTIKQWATYNKDWLDVEKKQDFFNISISELSKAKKEKYLNKLIIKLTSLSLK
jgi:hypothetical protein